MRIGKDEYQEGRLWNGFDYRNQAWVRNGRYVRCGHPESQKCNCYGRLHEGKETMKTKDECRAIKVKGESRQKA